MFNKFMLFVCLGFAFTPNARAGGKVNLKSPNGRINVEFKLATTGVENDVPFYRITFDGKEVIGASRMGLNFLGEPALGSGMQIKQKSVRSADSYYVNPVGKNREVRDHFNEIAVLLVEKKGSHRQLVITFRAYDDGAALQYNLPKQPSLNQFVISEEVTDVNIATKPMLHALPLTFASSYEAFYKSGYLNSFYAGQTLGLPLLLEYPGGTFVGITEAGLIDYAGMYLARSDKKPETLETRLAPMPKQPKVKVTGATPFTSPWRVFIIGESAKTLFESELVSNLNAPSVITDTSWIKPGKIQFAWWNGYILPHNDGDPEHKGGLNTWMLKRYIDFCAANKISYHSIDGFDKAWYGGPVDPYDGSDITKAIPELDLPEILKYARGKHVGTRIWLNGTALASNVDRALDTYASWGVEGIMVDFLNRDDQEMVQFYNELLRKTAQRKLTLTVHGVFKPTGLGRTYPHLLNHEAVLGTEYNKWNENGSTPEHELMISYVRMLAGPLDTHQGSFRPVRPKDYHMSYLAPRAIGTLARQLALYVVFENHLPMIADYPEAYDEHKDAFEFVQEVPVVWDETRMVAGKIGESLALARRKNQDWYIGAINDRNARTMSVPLNFLASGSYNAEVYADMPESDAQADKIAISTRRVTSLDTLRLELVGAGGYAVHLRKLP